MKLKIIFSKFKLYLLYDLLKKNIQIYNPNNASRYYYEMLLIISNFFIILFLLRWFMIYLSFLQIMKIKLILKTNNFLVLVV